MPLRLVSAVGLATLILLAWVMSENRRRANWRLVAIGVTLQVALGLLILRTGFGNAFFGAVQSAFMVVTSATNEGARFVFGNLTEAFTLSPEAVIDYDEPFMINAAFAFSVLPIVIVVSSIAAVLYHLRIIPVAVDLMARLMRRTLKTSGAETFGATLLVFLGIESIPTLKGYLKTMTRSELCTIMTVFMATIAADVMVIYAGFGAEPGHLMAASLMSAPAAILIAKLLVPETEGMATSKSANIRIDRETANVFDAAAKGASEGVHLAINIAALLIAFISIIFLLNQGLDAVTGKTFTEVMGWFLYPFAFLMGVPTSDIGAVAELLGTKTVLNEFLAYADMQRMIDAGTLEPRSITISTYALCGFANPGSLAILIAGLSSLVPERRREVTGLGIKSFVGGTLAGFTTACIAGILA